MTRACFCRLFGAFVAVVGLLSGCATQVASVNGASPPPLRKDAPLSGVAVDLKLRVSDPEYRGLYSRGGPPDYLLRLIERYGARVVSDEVAAKIGDYRIEIDVATIEQKSPLWRGIIQVPIVVFTAFVVPIHEPDNRELTASVKVSRREAEGWFPVGLRTTEFTALDKRASQGFLAYAYCAGTEYGCRHNVHFNDFPQIDGILVNVLNELAQREKTR